MTKIIDTLALSGFWAGVKTRLNNKADASHSHVIEDVTSLQTLLDGKANNVHTHTIANVTGLQTALDGKSDTGHTHSLATTTTAGHMSGADKSKLDGIASGANNYTHPSTHPAAMIEQDSTRRMVSDAQIAAWDGGTDELLEARGEEASLGERLDKIVPTDMAYVHISGYPRLAQETDDTARIQRAMNVAGPLNLPVYLPKGDFTLSGPITLSGKKVGVIGAGKILMTTLEAGIRTTGDIDLVTIEGLTFDATSYGTYSEHHDDPMGQFGVKAKAKVVNVRNCLFQNIYGNGIQAEGLCSIENNTFTEVTGFNPTEDPSGAYDNYGDGIHIIGASSKGSVIKGNYLKCANLGRGGIVIEFDPTDVVIESNYREGYNQSIHLELCGDVTIRSNYCTGGTTSLLVVLARAFVEANTFKGGTPTHLYNEGVVYCYHDYDGSVFRNNRIEKSGNSPRALQLSGKPKNVTFENNEIIGDVDTTKPQLLFFRKNIFRNGVVNNSSGISLSKYLENTFINASLSLPSQSNNVDVKDNHFVREADSPMDNVFIKVMNSTGALNIERNKFDIRGTKVKNYVINSYLGSNLKGDGSFSGNVILHDDGINLFIYGNDSPNHQPWFVKEQNYRMDSKGVRYPLTFDTKYDKSGKMGRVMYNNAIPTSGIFGLGDIIYNTAPAAGGFLGWVVTAAGGVGLTWAASTAYALGDIVVSSGKAYQVTVAGTSGATAPTHTTGEVTNGTATLRYMGGIATFKTFGAITA